MIEKSIDGVAHWWIPDRSRATHWNDPCRWTTDPEQAARYEDKADAEYVMGDQIEGAYVTEHMDCAPPMEMDNE